jgi:hypothetical protein
MFKKTLFSIGLTLCLLLATAAPALADAPDIQWYDAPAFTFIATDCSQYGYEFTIADTWDEEGHMMTFYNKDGSFDYVVWHGTVLHTFTNTVTGKSISASMTNTLIKDDWSNDIWEFHGFFQRFIVPGVGPIFMDGGHKIIHAGWYDNGSPWFEIIWNAGPTMGYTTGDFSGLCAYLAEP